MRVGRAMFAMIMGLAVVLLTASTVNAATRQVGGDINGVREDDSLGWSVAMSANGSRIVVGAPTTGAGYVLVLDLVDGQWQQAGRAIFSGANVRLGSSVAISADGSRVVASAQRAYVAGRWGVGKVEIYDFVDGDWKLDTTLVGREGDDNFGAHLAMNTNGSRLAVGAPQIDIGGTPTGEVRVFGLSGGVWSQIGSDIDGPEAQSWFGESLDMNAAGNRLVVSTTKTDLPGSFWNGEVHVYEFSGGDWQPLGQVLVGKNIFSDSFGRSVAMNAEGTRIVATAEGENNIGEARIFDLVGDVWTEAGTISGLSDELSFGPVVAITPDGSRIAMGTPGNNDVADSAGELRVFDDVDGDWVQVDSDVNGRAQFDDLGIAVAISADGTRVIAGAQGSNDIGRHFGQARVFDFGLVPVTCDGLSATIVGTAGDDQLVGTKHADVIAGLQGNDTIDGLGGDDVICGGKGNDNIKGGPGFDILYGAQGDDTLIASDGVSTELRKDSRGARMFGGIGNDRIFGSDRWDRMQGGPGADQLYGFEGRDWMRGGADNDELRGGQNIDDLHGGNGNDRFTVEGDDKIRGGAGAKDNCELIGSAAPNPLISCEILS